MKSVYLVICRIKGFPQYIVVAARLHLSQANELVRDFQCQHNEARRRFPTLQEEVYSVMEFGMPA